MEKVKENVRDDEVNARGKGEVYETVVRPVMTYRAEVWPTKRAQEGKLGVTRTKQIA